MLPVESGNRENRANSAKPNRRENVANRGVKLVRPGDEQTTWRGAGDEYRVLATGDDTAGDYFVMEAIVPPGGGPPPHIQTREEEAFYVLEGEVVFRAAGERIVGRPGAYLNIPRDVAHHFKNESDKTARMLIFFAPAGIERMFERMAADPDNYAAAAKEFGVEFVDKA